MKKQKIMKNKKPITGYVAKILNSRQLVINKGKVNGVKKGMIFKVLDTKGENIKDPESGKILGSIERPKVSLRIIQVKSKIAVAETFKSKEVNVGGEGVALTGFAKMFEPPKYIKQFETLKTNERTWEDLDESQSYVKSGDPVKQEIKKTKTKEEKSK